MPTITLGRRTPNDAFRQAVAKSFRERAEVAQRAVSSSPFVRSAVKSLTDAGDPVFSNSQGRRQTKRNIQQRLKSAIRRANVALDAAGIEALSTEVTPYSFRRTYSSLRASRWIDADGVMRPGDDPIYIAEQMGHTDPKFTFRVYQRAAKCRERMSGAHLGAFDRALQWAAVGRISPEPLVPNLAHPASLQGMPG